MKKVNIYKSDSVGDCASCGANNYSDRAGQNKVVIYELQIGRMINRLCKDCIKILASEIDGVIDASERAEKEVII